MRCHPTSSRTVVIGEGYLSECYVRKVVLQLAGRARVVGATLNPRCRWREVVNGGGGARLMAVLVGLGLLGEGSRWRGRDVDGQGIGGMETVRQVVVDDLVADRDAWQGARVTLSWSLGAAEERDKSPEQGLIATLPRILSIVQRLRKQPIGEKILHMPLRRRFSDPSPEDPAGMPLVRIELSLNEVAEVVLVIVGEARDSARVLSVAAPDSRAARKGAIVASAFAKAIEPFRAIGLCACPFADDGPLVSASEPGAEAASGGDVGGGRHCVFSWTEDLVLVGVEHDITIRLVQEAIPALEILEGVVDAHHRIAIVGAHGLVAAVVEVLDTVEVQGPTGGLIEELYRCHDIGVTRIMLCKVLDSRDSLRDRITLLPTDWPQAAGIVKAILTAWSSV